jgi:c-di-GMP-binding flagellar brake protein YcgR
LGPCKPDGSGKKSQDGKDLKILIDFFMGSLIHFNENGSPTNLRKHMTTVRRKREQTKPRAEKGIFIVERRKHPRFNVELPLDYSIENKDHYGGVAVNASRGGLIVYLPVAIVVGTSLNIEIIFVKGFELNSIKVRAKVIWSNLAPKVIWGEYRYGLEFEKFQEGDLQKLKALLREAGERTVDKERNRSDKESSALKRVSGPRIP